LTNAYLLGHYFVENLFQICVSKLAPVLDFFDRNDFLYLAILGSMAMAEMVLTGENTCFILRQIDSRFAALNAARVGCVPICQLLVFAIQLIVVARVNKSRALARSNLKCKVNITVVYFRILKQVGSHGKHSFFIDEVPNCGRESEI